jgi:hypothetical protein
MNTGRDINMLCSNTFNEKQVETDQIVGGRGNDRLYVQNNIDINLLSLEEFCLNCIDAS